jgi:hypothetical protein
MFAPARRIARGIPHTRLGWFLARPMDKKICQSFYDAKKETKPRKI